METMWNEWLFCVILKVLLGSSQTVSFVNVLLGLNIIMVTDGAIKVTLLEQKATQFFIALRCS